MSAVATLQSLFEFKRWSNRELFDLLATLPEQGLAPMLRTLGHIYTTDCIFVAHLKGVPHSYTSPHVPTLPALAELRKGQEETDDWYLQYLSTLQPEALQEKIRFRFTDGDMGSMSREEILQHICTHGCYHRGNVGQMLRDRGLPPPRDLFTRFLHATEPERRD